MNVNLELLKIFKSVAYHNSISASAKELCVTQPSVSKSIKKLEEQLNIILFVREKKGMKLTDEGKTLYRYIFDSLNTLDNTYYIAKNINELEIGELKIGAGISIVKNLLFNSIVNFKEIHPNLGIVIQNSRTENLYDDLRYGRLDIIFVNSTFNFNKNKYKYFELCEIEDIFFTSKEYYQKIKNVKDINKVIINNLIVQKNNFDTRTYLNRLCTKNNLTLKPLFEVDRHDLLTMLVLKDLGIGFATKEYLKSYLDSGELIELKTDLKIEKRKVIAVYRNNNSEKIKKFINLLKEEKYGFN